MSSYVFQFFCGDGRGPFRPAQVQVQGQTRPKALTAQPHPPPRPTSAPRPARLRQRPAEGEGQESSPRRTHRRRRRSPSRSASPHRARTASAPARQQFVDPGPPPRGPPAVQQRPAMRPQGYADQPPAPVAGPPRFFQPHVCAPVQQPSPHPYGPPSPQVYAQQYVPDMRRPAHPARPPSNRPPAPKEVPHVPKHTAKQPARITAPAQSSTDQAQLAVTDEHFLQGLMTADLSEVESQLELLLQGKGATDHIPKGLSTLTQFLLCRQQVLDNPHPEQWIMANWQAVRAMAGRTSLIRKYQRPFASLKEPERQRCASYLLNLFPEPVPCNTKGKSEFFGFVDCILQSRLQYERHITG